MTARSINLERQKGGGKTKFTCSDVAAALAYGNLSKPAYYLGRAKYCDDKAAEYALVVHLQEKIQQTIIDNKWRDAEGRAKNLALVVLIEGVYGLPCKHCQGSGCIWHNKVYPYSEENCNNCSGNGMGKLSGAKKARMIKISKSNWARTWEARSHHFIRYVSELEMELIKHLQQQFFTRDDSAGDHYEVKYS